MVFGGEGIFLATIRGTGRVWIQSLPFARLAARVAANMTVKSDDQSGSVLGQIGNLFE